MLIRDIDPNLISEVAVPISKASQIGAAADDTAGVAGIAQLGTLAGDAAVKGGKWAWNAAKNVGSKIAGAAAPVVAAGAQAAPAVSKLARITPGIGMVAGTADAVRRGMAGDYIGAGLSVGTGLASFLPAYGTTAALAMLGVQMARDKQRTNNWFAEYDDLEKATAIEDGMQPGGSPKVFAAQNDLIKQGYKNITATGQMDQATEAALKSMAKKNPVKENMDFIFEDIKQQPTQDQIRDPEFCVANGIETAIDPALEKDPAFIDAYVAARHYHKSIVKYNGKTYPVYLEADINGPDAPSGFTVSENADLARIKLLTRKLLNG